MLPSLPEMYRKKSDVEQDEEIIPVVLAVAEKSGNSFDEALEMPVDMFLFIYKASVLERLQSTEEGRQYLEKCDRLNNTELDKTAFRDIMRKAVK